MKLIYRGLKLDIQEWMQDNYMSQLANCWSSWSAYNYSYSDGSYYVNMNNMLSSSNKIICRVKDPEALRELMTRISNEPEQEALVRLSDGDFKIHNVSVDNVNTTFNLEGELEGRVTFNFTGEMEYIEGSKLGFFKE